MRNYYKINKKQVYYFKIYERVSSGADSDCGYGDGLTFVLKTIGTKKGVLEIYHLRIRYCASKRFETVQ
jgi:hypothetical protein